MPDLTFDGGNLVYRDGSLGLDEACCCGCVNSGPYCVSFAWDLSFDEIVLNLPGQVSGDAKLFIAEAVSEGDTLNDVRTCVDGAADNEVRFDSGFANWGSDIIYDAVGFEAFPNVSSSFCAYYYWSFDGFGAGFSYFLDSNGSGDGVLAVGVNNVDKTEGNLRLHGTITFSITPVDAVGDCGC
jgi:hypothetical protein